ncbi:hypothetical protein [Flagellimonas olearia]|uniref:hypothetical protein n=1 Tax=Flagellimonas olearia TaxID=552546 RepID=UPI00101D1C63|nr:hypothetical protein [Allomuricauda olearia]
MLFFINDIHIVGRKEIILFVIFAFFVHLLSKDQFKGFKEYLVYALLFVGVLFHEIFIFYAPYFVLTLWLFNKKVDYWKGARLYLSVLIPTCIVFFFGKAINEGESLNILKQRGIEFGSGQLSIFDFSNDLLSSIDRYLETPWGYSLYSVSLILGLLHVYYYLRKEHPSESKRILWSFLLLIGYSLPLFILVCDWGRWIQIHFVLLLLVLATLLPTKTKESVIKKTSLPVWKYSLAVMYIILLLTWRVYHFKNGFVLDGFLTYLFNKIV